MHGFIIETKVENISMTNAQIKFESKFKFLDQILTATASSIKTIEILVEKTDKTKVFYNYCRSFSNRVVYNFWAQSVIGLYECFKGKNSLEKLLNYANSNWNNIYKGQWTETTQWENGYKTEKIIKYTRTEVQTRLKEAKELLGCEKTQQTIDKIKDFRDTVFAHIDKKPTKSTLRIDELREVFNIAEEIFNKIVSMYDRIYRSLEVVNSNDINQLLNILLMYHENRKEIRELNREKQKKNEKQWN